MENTSENLEHIEHHQHAAHGGHFDRRVAVSMAIIAAMLATVTLLSHRAHNATLRLQGEANRLQTEANILHTQAADQWGFFQAKNIRRHEYLALSSLLKVVAPLAGKDEERNKQIAAWEAKAQEYDSEPKKKSPSSSGAASDLKTDDSIDPEKKNLKDIRAEAERLVHEADHKREEAEVLLKKSEEAHHQGDRLDLAELGVEVGLVLCSLAALTKRSPFWIAGVAAALIGVVLAGTAFLIH